MRDEPWTLFERHGATVAVAGSAGEVAAWLRPFVEPVAVTAAPPGSWTVLPESTGPAGAGWLTVDVPAQAGEPARRYWFHRADRRLLVAPMPPRWRAYTIMRAVRSLLKWLLATRDPLLFLHGAMVGRDGQGAVFIGPKSAGKTSSTLAALRTGATFVANDDVSVRRDAAGWTGLGWPRAVHVKPGSLAAVAGQRRLPLRLDQLRHPAHREPTADARGRLLTDLPATGLAGVQLTPAELAQAFEARIETELPVGAVVVVCHAEPGQHSPRLEPLSEAEATTVIVDNSLEVPEPIEDYWAEIFPAPGQAQRRELAAALAGSVPCFRLRQPLAQLERGTELVSGLLSGQRS